MDLQKQLNAQLSESETTKEIKVVKKNILNLRYEIDEINQTLSGKINEFKNKLNI